MEGALESANHVTREIETADRGVQQDA